MDKATIAAIEKVLAKSERVELAQTKDGIKVFQIERHFIHMEPKEKEKV